MPTLRTNEIRWAFDTRTTNLATDTTLAAAARHDTTSLTLEIPETGSRTILSAMILWTFRGQWSTSNQMISIRTGVKLGAAATVDLDRPFTQAGASNFCGDAWLHDVTAEFQASFGAAAVQTCIASIAVATTSASTIGGSICAELIVVYQYDDDVGTTRARSVPLMIGSHSTTLTAAQQEVGLDGAVPCPANQIPILDNLAEAGKSFKRAWIGIDMNDGTTSIGNNTHYVQIDATAESTRAITQRPTAASSPIRDNFIYDTATYSTATAHAFRMRSDVTARFVMPCATLWVTYTYDKSITTRIMNVVEPTMLESMLAWTNEAVQSYDLVTPRTWIASFEIAEPGVITLWQSGVSGFVYGSSATAFAWAAGGQAERTYTPVNISATRPFCHRADHSSGWSIARGTNRLTFRTRYTADLNRTFIKPYARIVYASDAPAGGPCAGARVCSFFNAQYVAGLATTRDVAASGGGQATITFDPDYLINGIQQYIWMRTAGLAPSSVLEQRAGEWDGVGFISAPPELARQPSILASYLYIRGLTELFNRTRYETGKFNVETGRRQIQYNVNSAVNYSWFTRVSYSASALAVTGTVIDLGVPAVNGTVVDICDAVIGTLLRSTTVSGGAGGFSTSLSSYQAVYALAAGAVSDAGFPGTDTFDVTAGSVISGGGPVYRMRAYDAGLAPPRLVYWNSSTLDAAGVDYAGPGPLSDVVLQVTMGQPMLALVPGTGIEAMPEQWVKLNVPANQAATAMSAQVSTHFDTLKAIRVGSIVGLGTRLNTPVTAGTLTVTITINGVAGTLAAVHTAGGNPSGAQVTQPTGVDDYVAGDLIGIQYATSVGFLPITADLEAWLQVVEVP